MRDAIRYNARTPLQGSLLPLTRLGLGMIREVVTLYRFHEALCYAVTDSAPPCFRFKPQHPVNCRVSLAR